MCTVTILSAYGIIPPGGANPTQLRVTGILTDCLTSNQIVISSSITAQSAPTSPINAAGDFVVTLPITASSPVSCGDTVTITGSCYGTATCTTTVSLQILCCQISNIAVNAVVPPGSLTPTAIK